MRSFTRTIVIFRLLSWAVVDSVLPSDCGLGANERTKRIVGGSVSEHGDWPWLVGLRMNPHYGREQGEGEVKHICAGVVIHKQYILTAAHCIKFDVPVEKARGSSDPNDYTLRLGDYNRTLVHSYQMDVQISHIHLYQGETDVVNAFMSGSALHDIALLKLREPLVMDHHYIQPICLPKGHDVPAPGTMLTVIGWGQTAQDGNQSEVVREIEIPVVSREKCRAAIEPLLETQQWTLPEDVICVGAEEGGKDSCRYDSGGPIMERIGGRWYLKGVVSIGFGCAQPGLYGLYTRVDHVIDWIENIINAES